jgi:transposase-like protein
MAVTPANRDALRERAFALSAQGIGVREIAARLGINKDTATKYVREERQRRSHDRQAEDAIRDAVTALRHVLIDLIKRYDSIEGDGSHANYARAKLAEAIRRYCRDLIGLYGVTLPETDPKIISMKRMLEMVAAPYPTPGGYPAVGEQAVLDRAYPDDPVIREAVPNTNGSECEDYYSGGWGDDVGEGY